MTEDLKQEEQTDATKTTTEETPTGGDQTKKPTVFSQEEVNKIISKEKAAWKKQSERASADNETIVEGLRKDITARDELITKQVDILVTDLGLDEETLELVNGLDTLARYEWIMKKVEKAGKQDVPRTPKGSGESPKNNTFKRTQTI